jgi:hypothetical protein
MARLTVRVGSAVPSGNRPIAVNTTVWGPGCAVEVAIWIE